MAIKINKMGAILLPRKSYIILGITICVCLTFMLLFNVPTYWSLLNIDSTLIKTEHELQVQQRLYPTYRELQDKLKKIRDAKDLEVLALPEEVGIPREKIKEITPMVEDIASTVGDLKILSVTIDSNSMRANAKYLSVEIKLEGEFTLFRDFLIRMIEFGCIKSVDDVRVETVKGTNTIYMKMWFFVE